MILRMHTTQLVGEPNSGIAQKKKKKKIKKKKNATLPLERYTADFLCIECLNIVWYETTV